MNIAFIPARCGSKSIKLKNVKSFCGKPLIYWNLKALQDSLFIHEIHVATECEEIKKIVKSFFFDKVQIFERDFVNASDTSSTESVMLEFLKKKNFSNDDNFILVQATSPLTETSDYEDALTKFKESGSQSLVTCVRVKRFFWDQKGFPLNYDFLNRPRRQDFEGTLVENGAFYISTVSNILKTKNRLTSKVSIFEMDEFKYIELDEENDWKIAESLMRKYIIGPSIKIKLFLSDVDGTLTDSGMYYSESGEELKKFNTHDGKGFELLRNLGIKTGIITSEKSEIVFRRSKKIKADYLFQGKKHQDKLDVVKNLCNTEGISMEEVAYIGDDINCFELLSKVGLSACPSDAVEKIKQIPGIIELNSAGGAGCVREFIEMILSSNAN